MLIGRGKARKDAHKKKQLVEKVQVIGNDIA